MSNSEIFKYTYDYDNMGYVINHNGIMIQGLSTIPEMMNNPNDRQWYEYHKLQAQNKLIQILKSKQLWQNQKAPIPLKK